MSISNYLKESFRLTSLIFTLLIMINWLFNPEMLVNNTHVLFIFSVISSLFSFLLEEHEHYSNRRLIVNQVCYIGIICLLIILGNWLLSWQMTIARLTLNLVMVIVIFLFIKFVMYSNDQKNADEINDFIKQNKQP
ncbi:DUF3021 family protein [Vagococcus salmoninarum]|uniref:DUF3021 family protein n=1 Tax=Vagococcus salmoninarum TaxID=2739 RepID=UPI003F96F02F